MNIQDMDFISQNSDEEDLKSLTHSSKYLKAKFSSNRRDAIRLSSQERLRQAVNLVNQGNSNGMDHVYRFFEARIDK